MNSPPEQKIALITGASSGIGRVTAEELAARGYKVFLACRSEAKTRPIIEAIAKRTGDAQRAEFLPLELGDFKSVRACAEMFLSRNVPLHLLINNAGLAGRGMTASGFETTFGVCHVGHFLLTQLLLARLKATAPARIVNVASRAHTRAREFSFDMIRKPAKGVSWPQYCQAKLANVLFTKELARRLQDSRVTSYAVHPGVVATDIWRSLPKSLAWFAKLFMISEERGAATTLYCATESSLANESGCYYADCRRTEPTLLAGDAALAQQLWEESERWTS